MANNTEAKCLQPIDHYKCKQCSLSCNFFVNLHEHQKLCLGSMSDDVANDELVQPKVVSTNKAKSAPFKWHECTQCGVILRTKVDLKEHLQMHSPGGQPFTCDQCDFKSRRKELLKSHIMSKHTPVDQIKWHQCEQCESTFKTKASFITHRRRHFFKDQGNWFQCDKCDYKTTIKHSYIQHVVIHKPPSQIKWFHCEQCGFKTRRKRCLQMHIVNMHTPCDEIEWHQCAQCEYKAKLKGALVSHMKGKHQHHPKFKWFQCEHCKYKSAQKSNFTRHMITHSSNQGERMGKL